MKHYLLPKNTKTHVLLWDMEFHSVGACVVGTEMYGTPATLAITARDYYFNEEMVIRFDNRFYCDFTKDYKYIHKDHKFYYDANKEKIYYRMFFYPEDCKEI